MLPGRKWYCYRSSGWFNAEGFEVSAYQRLDGDVPTEILANGDEYVRNYAKFYDVYSTVIVFAAVHWDENGNMNFGEMGEEKFAQKLTALKEIIAKRQNQSHSERRQYFGETDVTVRNRVRAALNEGLKVILCVGEVLSERKDGITSQIVSAQTEIALGGVSADELKNIIIAYEPVWAIGTGETATPEQANEVCAVIRSLIERLYGKDAADAIVVQYGGSMNDKNAAELLAQPDVDGGLIGGASLVAEKFTAIVNAASAK